MPKTTSMPPAPPVIIPPSLSTDVAELQRQLTLSRAQCAYLNRELAHAIKQGPMAPLDGTPEEHLRLENADLRKNLGTLKLHYDDAQQKIAQLTFDRNMAYKVLGWHVDEDRLFADDTRLLDGILKELLMLAHPDRWSQGQAAVDLAHDLTVTINAQRERLQGKGQ